MKLRLRLSPRWRLRLLVYRARFRDLDGIRSWLRWRKEAKRAARTIVAAPCRKCGGLVEITDFDQGSNPFFRRRLMRAYRPYTYSDSGAEHVACPGPEERARINALIGWPI